MGDVLNILITSSIIGPAWSSGRDFNLTIFSLPIIAAVSAKSNGFELALSNSTSVLQTTGLREAWFPLPYLNLTRTNPTLVSSSSISTSFDCPTCDNGKLIDGKTSLEQWQSAPRTDVQACNETVYVELNFKKKVEINEIKRWMYYGDARQYCNQRAAVSMSGEFTGEVR